VWEISHVCVSLISQQQRLLIKTNNGLPSFFCLLITYKVSIHEVVNTNSFDGPFVWSQNGNDFPSDNLWYTHFIFALKINSCVKDFVRLRFLSGPPVFIVTLLELKVFVLSLCGRYFNLQHGCRASFSIFITVWWYYYEKPCPCFIWVESKAFSSSIPNIYVYLRAGFHMDSFYVSESCNSVVFSQLAVLSVVRGWSSVF